MPRHTRGTDNPRPHRLPDATPEPDPAGTLPYRLPLTTGPYSIAIEDNTVLVYQHKDPHQPGPFVGAVLFIYPGTAKAEDVSSSQWDEIVRTLLSDGEMLRYIFSHVTSRIPVSQEKDT
jgi:hypothetical protein